MPAIDTLLKATGVTDNVSDEPGGTTVPDRSTGHFTFGDLMAKVSPEDEKDGAQNFPPQNRNTNPAKKQGFATGSQPENLTQAVSPESALVVGSRPKDKRSGTTASVGSQAKKPVEKNDVESGNVLPQTPNSLETLPVFLTLPLSACFNTTTSEAKTAAKTVAVKNNPGSEKGSPKTEPVFSVAGNAAGIVTSNVKPDEKLDTSALKPADDQTHGSQTLSSPGQSNISSNPSPAAGPASKSELSLLTADPSQASEKDLIQNPGGNPVEKVEDTKTPTEDVQVISKTPADASGDAVAKNDGTGVATDAIAMKNSENANKSAGSGLKNLPGGKIDPAHAAVPHLAVAGSQSHGDFDPDLNFLSGGNANSTALHEAGTLISVPLTTNGNVQTAERTSEMVAVQAVRLARSDAESLSVVIKPGAGTELSLELRQKNGVIEAQAVLQRGDFQALNQHWPDLQQKLEQRGIKLAPLGGENNFSSGEPGQFSRQQKDQSSEESAQQASAFAEFTMAMTRGGATARLAAVTNANEWWA